MPANREVRAVLERHLQSILDGDSQAYHATTAPELTLYEWYVTPHRIDGLPFHDFMLAEAARPDTTATALDPAGHAGPSADKARQRFDLANYCEQVYGDCAICSYTLLVSRGTSDGTSVRSHHETRVLIRRNERWSVVHVHKSPAWSAPYQPSGG
jgi:hypothetical protein